MSVESVIVAHLNAWNSPSGPERQRAIAEIYWPDVFVAEPAAALTGHAGVESAIAALQAQLPGSVITRIGPTQVAQDLATYAWTLGPEGADTIASGRDVLIIRDDKIASLYVVIDE